MAFPGTYGKEEETRDLHRVLRVFALKQEDWTENNNGLDMAASPDASGDDTEEAFVHTERDMNMKTFTKMTVALLMGALISIGALGCNTFKGAGKDIQKGGQGIENAAEGAQHK